MPPSILEQVPSLQTESEVGETIDIVTSDSDSDVIISTLKNWRKRKEAPSSVTTSESAEHQPRRSSRQRTSTVIHRGKYAIKKENDYEVAGFSYQYNTAKDAVAAASSNKKLSNKKNSKQHSSQAKTTKSRKSSNVEKKRMNHNQLVKTRIHEKSHKRNAFFQSHYDILEPFLDGKSADKLWSSTIGNNFGDEKPFFSKTSELIPKPECIQAELRPYQIHALNWMSEMHKHNISMILGDEMGLGKTLQTISFLCHLKEQEGISGPNLVICPLSVLYSWCDELQKWAPNLRVIRLHSAVGEERKEQLDNFIKNSTEYDVVVTTYDMTKTKNIQPLLHRHYFNYLVLDEGHKIKNHESQISQAVRSIHSENRLILTGTPLQNDLVELWSLLNFMIPDIFESSTHFSEAFDLRTNSINNDKLLKAQKLLSLFMIRRLKKEVEKLIPPKIETKVICPLSNTQISIYKSLLLRNLDLLAGLENDNAKDEHGMTQTKSRILQNLCMQLRKCSNHPFLFDGIEDENAETSLQMLVAVSGKLSVLDKLLCALYEQNHRVVIFSQFKRSLDIIDDYCRMRGWKYSTFSGETSRAMRKYIVDDFNQPHSDKFLLLMTTRSGGMGLNLQTADTCVLFDSDWNPQPDIQAMARVHRIGQQKTVHVYRLISGGTVEERILERAEKKLYLDKMVNYEDSPADVEAKDASVSEVLSALKFGCDAVFGEAAETMNTLPTDEDINFLTDRSRTVDMSLGQLKGGVSKSTRDFDHKKELSSTGKLKGIDFREIQRKLKEESEKANSVPKNLQFISVDLKEVQQKDKRERKSRLLEVKVEGFKQLIPVLVQNDYELDKGETSVFQREIKPGVAERFADQKKTRQKFEHQDLCQVCGDGGTLLCCSSCPVCVHPECIGFKGTSSFHCSHHKCSVCLKAATYVGGLLFACQSCPVSFCEDHLHSTGDGLRILGKCERLEKHGYETGKNTIYIHCSKECEKYAIEEFAWSPPKSEENPQKVPALDVSFAFGCKVDETM